MPDLEVVEHSRWSHETSPELKGHMPLPDPVYNTITADLRVIVCHITAWSNKAASADTDNGHIFASLTWDLLFPIRINPICQPERGRNRMEELNVIHGIGENERDPVGWLETESASIQNTWDIIDQCFLESDQPPSIQKVQFLTERGSPIEYFKKRGR
jgi:hypothetical protein